MLTKSLLQQAPLSLTPKQKIILLLLAAVLCTIPLWLGLERVHSAPAKPASPPLATALPLPGPTPSVTLDVPNEVLINEPFTFNITFHPGNTVGYGPFIDLVLPAGGIDYNASSLPCDGVTFVSGSARMVGVNGGPIPLTANMVSAPCITPTGACATLSHPYASSGITTIKVPEGAQLVTIALPFGSFQPDQPPIVIQVTAQVSDHADVNAPLNIYARAGFRFGSANAENDFLTDLPVISPGGDTNCTIWTASAPVTPVLFTFKVEDRYTANPGPCFDGIDNGNDGGADSADPECGNGKTYDGPEDETVTGPNFPHHYKIILNIAKGMTVTNLNVQDCIPNNMVVSNAISAPASIPSPITPLGPVNSTCMTFNYSSILGGSGVTDIVIELEFYIPEMDATPAFILKKDCNPVLSINDVKANGFWIRVDNTRDPAGTVISNATPQDHILTDKCLAIQKRVTLDNDTGASGPTPGDTLRYELNFQVSDFKTFGDLEVIDRLSDGQSLVGNATLTVTDQFNPPTSGNFILTTDLIKTTSTDPSKQCGVVNGVTELTFKVSQKMMSAAAAANPRHSAGILTGGRATSNATAPAATGQIVFFTEIEDTFTFAQPGDQYVDKDDPINNCVTIDGKSLTNVEPPSLPTTVEGFGHDNSSKAIAIVTATPAKSVYAVQRGGVFICGPLAVFPFGTTCSNFPMPPQEVRPGDDVTFRIEKMIPSTDAEKLTIQDWLPLPIFKVTGFGSTILPCAPGTVPSANNACFHALDTLHNSFTPSVMPTVASNSIKFDYGDIFDSNNATTKIDLLFTSTVMNLPFADGFFLTNQVQECEKNSFDVTFCQSAIAQVNLREPVLRIRKGVIATDNTNGQFGQPTTPPSTIAQAPPGVTLSLAGIAGVVNHAGLATGLLNSDISNVDANDLVTFAVTVENVGGHPAYDVKLEEIIPADCFTIVPGTIQVKLGSEAAFTNTVTGPGPGFTLTAPGPLAAFDPNNDTGANIIVITFQAKLKADIKPGCCQNRAEIKGYTSVANGPDFVMAGFNPPFEDFADVCTKPTLTKSVVATSEGHTAPQTSTIPQTSANTPQVTIGEIVRYRLVVRLPEGTAPNFQITDALPLGMKFLDGGTARLAFVSNVSPIIHIGPFSTAFDLVGNAPPASATLNPMNPVPAAAITGGSGCGAPVTFSLGDVQNNDNDDDLEYVVIEFNALVCNMTANVNGVTLTNTVSASVTGSTIPISPAPSINVTVVEPNLTITKIVTPTTVLEGGTVTYTVTITNGPVDAFDVQFADTLPPALTLVSTTVSVAGNCSPPTGVNTTVPSVTCANIPANGVVTIKYDAKAPLSCPLVLTNQAKVTWTSLPGTQGTIVNPTMFTTPGSSGASDDGERNGVTPSLTLNDYAASVSAPLTVTCPPCVAAPAALVDQWPFDEASGTTTAQDTRGVVNNLGTHNNGPSPSPGRVGGALCFDGVNDFVQVADESEIDFPSDCPSGVDGPFTIDAWVKTNDSSGVHTILDKRVNASQPVGYSLFLADGRLGFQLADGSMPGSVCGTGTSFPCTNYVAPAAGPQFINVASGVWHFVAVTVTKCPTPVGRMYVDGTLVLTFTPRTGNIVNNTSLQIGRRDPAFDNDYFDGCIDELEFFKRALTEDEIRAIFEAGGGGKCPCPTVTINPATLVNQTWGANILYPTLNLTATGGTGPYSFTVTGGSLPPGIVLASNGTLQGTPLTPGTYTFTVTVTNANGCRGERQYQLVIIDCPPITLNPASGALPAAIVNAPHEQIFTATGGCSSSFTYSVTGGALPLGLTLSSNGVLSGTATQLGGSAFTVTATDSCGCSLSQAYTLNVENLSFGTSGIKISEFRLDGPSGAGDEFVELVNNTGATITILSTNTPGTGWSVWGIVGSAPQKICTIPEGTTLVSGQHFLCAKTPDYELGLYAAPDDDINNYTTLGLDVDGGVALFSATNLVIGPSGTWSSSTGPVSREDAVGFRGMTAAAPLSFAPAFREGSGLNPIGPQDPAGRAGKGPDDLREYSFVRKHVTAANGTWSGPVYQDTNDNSVDWVLVSNRGDLDTNFPGTDTLAISTLYSGSTFDPSPVGAAGSEAATVPVFGAPGPQNLASPLERNYGTQFIRSLFDTGSAANVSPNTERNSMIVCGGSRGDLILRFTYRNALGINQSNLRVRFIDLSTLNRNNPAATAILDLLDTNFVSPGLPGTRNVFVNNGRDNTTIATGNDPTVAPGDGSGGNPSGDGIVNHKAAGGAGAKVVRGTFVEGVDKTPPVTYTPTNPPPMFSGTQQFRQVNPSWTDLDGSQGTPCRVGGFNSATVAFPPMGPNANNAGVTTTVLPAILRGAIPPGGSISLEHRFGVIRAGSFVIVGIIESN